MSHPPRLCCRAGSSHLSMYGARIRPAHLRLRAACARAIGCMFCQTECAMQHHGWFVQPHTWAVYSLWPDCKRMPRLVYITTRPNHSNRIHQEANSQSYTRIPRQRHTDHAAPGRTRTMHTKGYQMKNLFLHILFWCLRRQRRGKSPKSYTDEDTHHAARPR